MSKTNLTGSGRATLQTSSPAVCFALVLALLVLAWCSSVHGQEAARSSSNRWLFIIETSRAMQSRAPAVQQIAAGMIRSGMNGQMRPGDTLGLWTFNDAVHAGRFPLQQWTGQNSNSVAGAVLQFLRAQKYEKDARFGYVLPEMERVIAGSEFITLVLITDGSAEMRGTPFDAEINAQYRAWRREQGQKQMPFVTLLRAAHGTITHFVVNTPPFPFDLPPLPEELLATAVSSRSGTEKPPSRTTVPPLIVSGKKPEAVATNTAPAGGQPLDAQTNTMAAPPESSPPQSAAPPPSAAAHTDAATQSPSVKTQASETPSPSQARSPSPKPAPPENLSVAPSQAVTAPALKGSEEAEAPVPIQSGTAAEPRRAWRNTVWIAAISILVLAGASVLLVIRGKRRPRASLITRSLDRDKK